MLFDVRAATETLSFVSLYVQTDDDDWLAYTSGRLAQHGIKSLIPAPTHSACSDASRKCNDRLCLEVDSDPEEAAGVGHAVEAAARTREVEAPETYTIASVSRHGTSEDSMHLPRQPGGTRPMGRSLRRRLAEAKCPVTWAEHGPPACGQPQARHRNDGLSTPSTSLKQQQQVQMAPLQQRQTLPASQGENALATTVDRSGGPWAWPHGIAWRSGGQDANESSTRRIVHGKSRRP